MFSRNEAAGNQGQGNRRARSSSLRASLAWALALPVSLVLLLSLVGSAVALPLSHGDIFTAPLANVTPAVAAAPSVTSITPAEGPTTGGTVVKIKGTGFVKGDTVLIGREATSVEVISETEITAKTAETSAGSNEVVVEDEEEEASAEGPKFTFVRPAKVKTVTPSSGSTLGGTSVVIKGTGFVKGATVKIGGAATSVEVVSGTEIKAKTAASAAGEDEVVVTIAGGGASKAGAKYTFITPPSVTKVEPATGSTAGGTKVVITGTGFVEGAKVKIGSEATEVEVVSETEIKAKTAATVAGADAVSVADSKGVSAGGPSFTYVAPPKVSSVEAASGPTTGGTSVKIKGTGFLKGSTVTVGEEATSVKVVSETEVTAVTAAHAAGAVEVVVTSEMGASTAGPKFTFVTPPTVEKVTPASGSTLGGTAVVVKGTGFVAGATVKIGSAATSVEVVSATEIKAKTAATAAGEDEVVVTIAGGGASKEGPKFTFVTPPSVTAVSPAEGSTAGGTVVKVKGTGFVSGAKVTIGAEATEVEVVSATEISAKTAAHAAGAQEVVVEDEKGVSAGGSKFTYVTPPTVEKVTPSSGTTLGGTSVVIKGTGFVKGATVKIGSAATSVEVVSATEIKAKTAATAAGEDEVVVTIAGGGASKEGPKYTYITPPSVTKVEPATGSTLGGTEVVITGTGFVEGAKVKIGSEATAVEVVSETEIKAKTAATAAGADAVSVADSKGVSAAGPSFTYVAPPKVTSVEPATGPTTGGTSVKIKGTGFLKGSTVKIGEEATSVKVVSETEVTAVTAAHAAGAVEVVVTSEMGTSSAGPKFTYVTPPTVTKIEPSSGSTLGGTSVVIKGTGFVKGATVKIGSTATSVEVVSETEIKAKTAATAAGEDEVIVTIAGGGPSKEGPKYTYIAPPTVTAITPSKGTKAGGVVVKIKGTGFVTGAKVFIGGEATEVEVISATEISAKTAASSPGTVEVVVEDEKGTSSGGPKYTYE